MVVDQQKLLVELNLFLKKMHRQKQTKILKAISNIAFTVGLVTLVCLLVIWWIKFIKHFPVIEMY
jgi:predicted ABC-type exoprotein transport system permease subunit